MLISLMMLVNAFVGSRSLDRKGGSTRKVERLTKEIIISVHICDGILTHFS
jgi:hypothetical protein